MGYIMNEKISKMVKEKINASQIAREVGITDTYISLIKNRKIHCSKPVAYAITKALNSEAEVEDYFDRI